MIGQHTKRRMKMNDEKQMITIDGKEYDYD